MSKFDDKGALITNAKEEMESLGIKVGSNVRFPQARMPWWSEARQRP